MWPSKTPSIKESLTCIAQSLREIVWILKYDARIPDSIRIYQVDERGGLMSVLGVPLGGQGTFQETPSAPPGAAFPGGTAFTWTADDPSVQLQQSASGTSCIALVPSTDTKTSFNLTCTTNFTPPGAASPLGVTVNVPILPASVPTPTAMEINQTA